MSRRTRLLVALAAGLGILLVVGAALWLRGNVGATPEKIAAALERSPDDRLWAEALRTHYPGEYRTLLGRMAAAERAGGSDAGLREAATFLDRFVIRKVNAIASAPDARLREIASAMADAVRTLRGPDARFCAQFVTAQTRSFEVPDVARSALSRATGLMISAAHAGETSGRRSRRRASAADLAAWAGRIAAIDPRVGPMIEDGSIERAPQEQQCRAALLTFQAVAELPPPVGAAVMAEILRQGAEAPD